MPGLSLSRLVNVEVALSALQAQRRGFGTALCLGDSAVINGVERFRLYSSIEAVQIDFGLNAEESKFAALYFGQSPAPKRLMIGRWFRTASSGFVQGAALTTAEQLIGSWTSITNGTFRVSVDGVVQNVTGLNFAMAANLNAVAAVINLVLTGATVAWDGSRFNTTSITTGTSSSISYLSSTGSGTDISAQLKMTSGTATLLVPGYAAELPVDAAVVFASLSPEWYALAFAAATMPTGAQNLAVADYIKTLVAVPRIFGATEIDTRTMDVSYTADLASVLKATGNKRATVQYSENKLAVASLLGRELAVDFNGNRTAITMMYKQEPSVTPQLLNEAQANALQTKRCNVFVKYINDTSIVQYGTMAGDVFIDEIHGMDWLQNAIQSELFNTMFTAKTKVPQTDAGQNRLLNAVAVACQQGVNNGLIGPGTWNADGFGQLQRGDFLQSGFYIYSAPIALQLQAERELRKAPIILVAVKLAGAVHTVDCIVSVNR